MTFRFRRSLGFRFGRLNLGKTGVSYSLGRRGNVINFGRHGMRHTLGIPGTGFSYSRKLGDSPSRRASIGHDEKIGQAKKPQRISIWRVLVILGIAVWLICRMISG